MSRRSITVTAFARMLDISVPTAVDVVDRNPGFATVISRGTGRPLRRIPIEHAERVVAGETVEEVAANVRAKREHLAEGEMPAGVKNGGTRTRTPRGSNGNRLHSKNPRG